MDKYKWNKGIEAGIVEKGFSVFFFFQAEDGIRDSP
ncbi:hypothetical protein CDFC105_53670 [Clostridioides difficile]|nr:hypothetical protein CDFC105_53670 [Clostridioides difficile]